MLSVFSRINPAYTIFERDYSNLKHLKKCNKAARFYYFCLIVFEFIFGLSLYYMYCNFYEEMIL